MLAHLQSVVADLGERALRGAPLSQMLDDAANQVAQALGVDYCKILELLPNRDALLMRSGAGWKPGYVGHATVGLGTDSQAGYTLLSGEPVVVEDLQTEKRFAGTALLHEHEVVSGASVVISTTEGPYGVLAAHTRHRRSFTADEVNFLQAVANVLGSVIDRHRAEAQLWRVNQAQRVLSKCNEALIRATEESTLLQQICDLIVEEAGYRLCWVGRAENDAAKSVTVIAQAGFEAGYLATLNITWADTERGRGPTGTCIRTRETVVTKRIATDPKMIPWRAEALKRGYGSSVSIPLIVDSQAFGAIMIYAAEPDAFGAEEVGLLTRTRQRPGIWNRHLADQGRARKGRSGSARRGRARTAPPGLHRRGDLRPRSRRQLHLGQSGLRADAGLYRCERLAREKSSWPGPLLPGSTERRCRRSECQGLPGAHKGRLRACG